MSDRCICGCSLPPNPYRVNDAPRCEACYARWVRGETEQELKRDERREAVSEWRQGKTRCKECGGLFKIVALEGGLCGPCNAASDMECDE